MSDGSVTIDTILNTDGAKKGLGSLQGILGKVETGIGTAFKAGATAIAGVSTAISGAVGYGAKYNATIEQYATSFEVMTGSVEKATEVTEKLKKIGAETPFEMTDLADTTQLLMNYGFTADDAMSKMQMLGDISQGSADKMNRIAMAYGQMSSAGKVQLEDVKQMIEAGFNPLQEISQSTGESMESLYDRISKGTISVDEITASMERSTSAGGKYFQSMQKQSQTVSGQISTLKDNASQLLGSLSSNFSTALGGQILPMLNEMTGGLQEAFNTGGIEGFVSALGPALGNITTQIANQLPSIIQTGTSIITSLLTGIQQNLPQILLGASQILTSLIQGIITILPQLMPIALQILQTLITTILQNLPLILNAGIQLITQLITGIAQMIPQLVPQMIDCLMTIINTLLDNIDLIIDAGIQLIISLAEGLLNAIPQLIEKIPIIIQKLVQAIINNLPKIIEMGIRLLVELGAGLIAAIPQLIAMIPQIISAIINAFLETDWGAVGLQLLQGLLNGFSNAGNIIWNAIKKVGNSMIDGIKSFFGIHSPSKVFMALGKYLPQGFAVGINKESKSAIKSTQKLNNAILDNFNLNNMYSKMRSAVALQTSRIATNLSTTANVSKSLNANITVEGSDIYMDSTKVGRAVTPTITRTLKGAGAY